MIDDTITRTTVHGDRVKLRDVFTVHIPAWRQPTQMEALVAAGLYDRETATYEQAIALRYVPL